MSEINRTIGGILLIVGTCVGGGMLALPLATAGIGFFLSSLILVGIWALMTFSAYLILEVNLLLAPGTNLISMARVTLGRGGAMVMWVTYLLLLYALLSAFTAGGGDLVYSVLSFVHWHFPAFINSLIFIVVLGSIVMNGIRGVDFANRILLTVKLVSFLLAALLCLHLVKLHLLMQPTARLFTTVIMPVVTSFGYAIIMPSLRVYLKSDVPRLRQVIFWGSLIPLILYLVWSAVVQGIIPGVDLLHFAQGEHAVSDVTHHLSFLTHNVWIAKLSQLFTIICITTSFLGVSLCLIDFLRDGWGIKKRIHTLLWLPLLAFVPPLVFVSFTRGLFIKALSYAGVLCVILLILLPGLMAYRARYQMKLLSNYQVVGGKFSLGAQLISALLLLLFFCRF